MRSARDSSGHQEYDPTFLHSRREAIIIFSVWLTALIWVVPFCYLTGYIDDFDPASFSTTWGLPTWLFWGILIPWVAANIFTIGFCFFYMADDDLGETVDDTGDRSTPDEEAEV